MSFFAPFTGSPIHAHGAMVGTFLGDHTIAELQELLAAKDYEQKQIEAASIPILKNAPPAIAADWIGDWTALKTRYGAAAAAARAAIASSILPGTVSTAEPQWQGILHALTRQEGFVQKGDVQDLYNRIVKLGAKVDETGRPQPSASSDADLFAFKKLDAGIRAGEGAVADAAHSNTALLIGGGIALGVGLLLVLRR